MRPAHVRCASFAGTPLLIVPRRARAPSFAGADGGRAQRRLRPTDVHPEGVDPQQLRAGVRGAQHPVAARRADHEGQRLYALTTRAVVEHLDAAVARTASLDTAFPFAQDLERNFMANARLEDDLEALLAR